MFQCLPDFGPCFNYVYDQKSTDGIFIFHGFPSQKNRNKDLAFFLSQSTNASVFVHHYEGLGESLGQFFFEKSITTAEKYVRAMIQRFDLKRVHFLGHSWGGFVSMNLLPIFHSHLASLVLFSPFTEIPDQKGVALLAKNLMTEYPHFFFHRSFSDVCDEFLQIQKNYSYREKVAQLNWNKPVQILQAKNDLLTPEEKTKGLLPILGPNLKYQELEIDHSFTENRKKTFELTALFYTGVKITR